MTPDGAHATFRRSRLEIHLDVLRAIRDGTQKPSHIMAKANLAWNPLQRILRSLASQGLIVEIDVWGGLDKRTVKRYEITSRGLEVLRYFRLAERLGLVEVRV